MSLAVQPLAPALADGVTAFQARAYDRALAVFQPLAEAGDPETDAAVPDTDDDRRTTQPEAARS